MIKTTDRHYTLVACGILVLVMLRIAVGAAAPLAFDEAYYWRLSQHLASGYLDHPPMVAAVIRLGTLIVGDTQLGVRLVAVLLALPATWAVWRAAAILFRDDRLAATAALFFNLMLIVTFGTVIVTPDCPLLAASAFVVFFLAKLTESAAGAWWLAVGAAVGAGLLSKYTALFLGASILAWMLIVPEARRWLATPWPWLGGLIAFAMFTPVVLWNARHHWDSFIFQFHRIVVDQFTLRYLGEYFAVQFGLATPSIFILGVMGLLAFMTGRGGTRCGRILLGAMVWPLVIYLAWHSLHERVQGNWTTPIFPAFAIAAAAAAHGIDWRGHWRKLADWSNRLTLPIALGIIALISAQATFGILPLGAADPTVHQLGAGWRQLGIEIDAIRREIGADVILTTDYPSTGWLSFYLPSHVPVVEVNERYRWANEPSPSPDLFAGTLMYLCPSLIGASIVKARYKTFDRITSVVRRRGSLVIERYVLFRVGNPIGDPLDRTTLAEALMSPKARKARERHELAKGGALAVAPPPSCESVGDR